ncbi:hypothetical protein [Oleidesulfovibrio alaskensis]
MSDDDLDDMYGETYLSQEQIDYSIIASRMKWLPFFDDDLYLGMQAMNIGLVDPLITAYEYDLLRELFTREKTPVPEALTVSALSQMWIYSLYEVLRMWRDRMYEFKKWFENGGIDPKLSSMGDEFINMTLDSRKNQLKRYKDDEKYRIEIDMVWENIEPVFRLVELVRINLAKHCAPGKNNLIPRAPGYGRINSHCGALDYDILIKKGWYDFVNRRDIADALRECLLKSVPWDTQEKI